MNIYTYKILVVIILFSTLGCSVNSQHQKEFSDKLATLDGDGIVNREALGYEFLISGKKDTIVDYLNYAVPENAAFPKNTFQGKLKLKWLNVSGKFEELLDWYDYAGDEDIPRKHLPDFDYEFIQEGSHIIPIQRGYIQNKHVNWEYVLEPGRVWDEKSDEGYSRVAIPFALKQKNQNCVHNGVMMFLFKNDGSISKVAYQIASETCGYFQFNMWGTVKAKYTPEENALKNKVFDAYAKEVEMRMPSKPIEKLAEDFSGANPTAFSAAKEMKPEHMTLYGFVIDGVNYVGGCNTRYGKYPYCDVMVLPSYSTAKSVSAGFGLMRLEKEYPGIKSETIAEYIKACAKKGIWDDVTFENALDMATGNYESAKPKVDEEAFHMNKLFLPETHKEKIAYCCGYFERKSKPGTQWVYHTSDTYIVGTAMNNYLQKTTNNPEADYFKDLIVDDIFTPLGMSPTSKKQLRTYDSTAQPFSGYGLFYHHDDAAKIGQFLIDGATVEGKTLFDEELYSEIIYPSIDSSLQGTHDKLRYDNGFWFLDVSEEKELCAHNDLIPYLSGYGGIRIYLLPNNTIYYYFSDNFQKVWKEGIGESNNIRPFCTKKSDAK